MFDEVEDDDEQFFAEELRAKQHKEQMSALKGIATLLNKPEKPNEDKQIIDAINKQGAAIEKVAAAIQNQPKPEKPEVNVTTDNKEILPLLKEIKEGNENILRALENKPMVEKFDFEKDNWGGIKTAKVVYTPANKITISKSKYQA